MTSTFSIGHSSRFFSPHRLTSFTLLELLDAPSSFHAIVSMLCHYSLLSSATSTCALVRYMVSDSSSFILHGRPTSISSSFPDSRPTLRFSRAYFIVL